MGKSNERMVYATLVCYDTGQEFRIGRWKLDSPRHKSDIPGIIFIDESDKESHYHFYFDSRIRQFGAHIKDNTTMERILYGGTLGGLRRHLIEKIISEAGINTGKLPWGFVRQVEGMGYPKPLKF